MAGDAIHGQVRAWIGDEISVPIMVMIMCGSAHTPAAHPTDNKKQ